MLSGLQAVASATGIETKTADLATGIGKKMRALRVRTLQTIGESRKPSSLQALLAVGAAGLVSDRVGKRSPQTTKWGGTVVSANLY